MLHRMIQRRSCLPSMRSLSNSAQNAKKKVVFIGFIPEKLDLSAHPDITAQKIRAGLDADVKTLNDKGYDASHYLVDPTDFTSTDPLKKELPKYDVVLIGAGVRTLPIFFLYFEKLINLVHEHARPTTKICFNTGPFDSAQAVERWSK